MTYDETDWDILKRVAELSPPEYADQIRERYQWAAARIQELLDATDVKEGEDSGWYKADLPCPHCWVILTRFACCTSVSRCIWATVMNASMACIKTRFAGLSYCDGIAAIALSCDDIAVCAAPVADLDNALAYVNAHVEWANKPWWGKKYMPGK